MKTVRAATILLVVTLLTVIVNSIVLKRMINDISDEVIAAEEKNTEKAYAEYTEIYEKYKKKSTYISLTVSHEDLTDIENSFAEIIGAAKGGDIDGIITVKSRLVGALNHLGRLSGINLDSIF